MKLPSDIEKKAFKSGNEYAWKQDDIPSVIEALLLAKQAILGGELWMLQGNKIIGLIPQKSGPPAVYPWETERINGERWDVFIKRCAEETQNAIAKYSVDEDMFLLPGDKIYFNLSWISEEEY